VQVTAQAVSTVRGRMGAARTRTPECMVGGKMKTVGFLPYHNVHGKLRGERRRCLSGEESDSFPPVTVFRSLKIILIELDGVENILERRISERTKRRGPRNVDLAVTGWSGDINGTRQKFCVLAK